ncbi:hypothetical protein PHLGIDRAFT_28234 [Phlebiopsis gigantea 11061_1 CR5-6]|uniref:DUF7727 domain-containing protein n=1 Tax=Phlebiopsis gigantea (strain 11061_1 CR5-6) TaxID=745531 RepID=A0A0C3NZQ4_PHLG1|nr:hypothetical protein PHLGIDRAFT_28234 [Phlebiopsis gigantea 11061_1 CR5-6]
MGNLIWHEWSRYVSLTATVYTIWAAFWGFLYRKFFWDFVGGTLRAPGGLQPADNVAVFIDIIVKAPIVQILSMILGFGILALEYPAPFLKGTSLYRSLVMRIVVLLLQAFLAILYYQGTNGAIWSLVAVIGYMRAIMLGESMAEAKENRGRGGKA